MKSGKNEDGTYSSEFNLDEIDWGATKIRVFLSIKFPNFYALLPRVLNNNIRCTLFGLVFLFYLLAYGVYRIILILKIFWPFLGLFFQ